MRAHLHTYLPDFITALFSLRTRPLKSRIHKNGWLWLDQPGRFRHLCLELSLLYLPLITFFASFICWLWLHKQWPWQYTLHVVLLCVLMHSVTLTQHVQNWECMYKILHRLPVVWGLLQLYIYTYMTILTGIRKALKNPIAFFFGWKWIEEISRKYCNPMSKRLVNLHMVQFVSSYKLDFLAVSWQPKAEEFVLSV